MSFLEYLVHSVTLYLCPNVCVSVVISAAYRILGHSKGKLSLALSLSLSLSVLSLFLLQVMLLNILA